MSSSKKQQLAGVKAALQALQAEIKEAKEERKAAKSQLEKAIQEETPDSIHTSFKSLYEGASTFLNGLQREKKELLKQVYQLSSPSSSDDELQEISPTSESSPKRRKVDDLIAKSKKYLLRTERWGCVTIIEKRKAVTFAHGEHCALQPGMSIKIYSIEGDIECEVKVFKTNARSDWVLLESGVDLCEDEPKKGLTTDGHGYIQLGLSATTQQESPFSTSKGVISSSRLNKFGHILGSAGANPGDSGGPCFDESTWELIGMNVGCENVPINPDKDTVTQTYDKISSRYAARAHIIPIASFQFA